MVELDRGADLIDQLDTWLRSDFASKVSESFDPYTLNGIRDFTREGGCHWAESSLATHRLKANRWGPALNGDQPLRATSG